MRSARSATHHRSRAARAPPPRRGSAPARSSSSHSEKTSSHWSTTRTGRRGRGPGRRARPWDAAPGSTTTTARPSRRSAAATPARTSDDFPTAGRPDHGEHPARPRARCRHVAESVVPPEERPRRRRSSYGARPRYGQVARSARRRRHRPAGAGSCRRIACSSATTLRPRVQAELLGQHPRAAGAGCAAPPPAGRTGTAPAPAAATAAHAAAPPRPWPAPRRAPRGGARPASAASSRSSSASSRSSPAAPPRCARLPLLELGQRPAAPQRERLVDGERCRSGSPEGQQLAGPRDQRARTAGRRRASAGRTSRYPLRRGLDRLRPELLAQPAHAALHVLAPSWPAGRPPDRVRELVRRPHLARSASRARQAPSGPATEPDRAAVDHQRAEHAHAHDSTVRPSTQRVNRADTAEIPLKRRAGTAVPHNGGQSGDVAATDEENLMNTQQQNGTHPQAEAARLATTNPHRGACRGHDRNRRARGRHRLRCRRRTAAGGSGVTPGKAPAAPAQHGMVDPLMECFGSYRAIYRWLEHGHGDPQQCFIARSTGTKGSAGD